MGYRELKKLKGKCRKRHRGPHKVLPCHLLAFLGNNREERKKKENTSVLAALVSAAVSYKQKITHLFTTPQHTHSVALKNKAVTA